MNQQTREDGRYPELVSGSDERRVATALDNALACAVLCQACYHMGRTRGVPS